MKILRDSLDSISSLHGATNSVNNKDRLENKKSVSRYLSVNNSKMDTQKSLQTDHSIGDVSKIKWDKMKVSGR